MFIFEIIYICEVGRIMVEVKNMLQLTNLPYLIRRHGCGCSNYTYTPPFECISIHSLLKSSHHKSAKLHQITRFCVQIAAIWRQSTRCVDWLVSHIYHDLISFILTVQWFSASHSLSYINRMNTQTSKRKKLNRQSAIE